MIDLPASTTACLLNNHHARHAREAMRNVSSRTVPRPGNNIHEIRRCTEVPGDHIPVVCSITTSNIKPSAV